MVYRFYCIALFHSQTQHHKIICYKMYNKQSQMHLFCILPRLIHHTHSWSVESYNPHPLQLKLQLVIDSMNSCVAKGTGQCLFNISPSTFAFASVSTATKAVILDTMLALVLTVIMFCLILVSVSSPLHTGGSVINSCINGLFAYCKGGNFNNHIWA